MSKGSRLFGEQQVSLIDWRVENLQYEIRREGSLGPGSKDLEMSR